MKDFCLFVANLFPPGDFLSNLDTVVDVFRAITNNKLWSYLNYNPLQEICKEFGKDDPMFKEWLNKYVLDLAGFKATTKIIDYIEEHSNKEDADDSELDDPERPLSQYAARYDKRYYRKLTLKLKVKVTKESLEYIDEFWRSVADLFSLTSLPVLLDSIHEGCTEITWLIPTKAASQIKLDKHSLALLEKFELIKVTLDGKIIYPVKKVKVRYH